MLTIIFLIYTALEIIILTKAFKTNKQVAKESIGEYLFIIAIILIKRIFALVIPDYSIILVILTVICHIFIGKYLNFYNTSIRYDRYLHAFGAFAFAVFSYCVILAFVNPAVHSKMITAIFVFAIGLSLGLLCEMSEFISDITKRKKIKSQRGLIDTDLDMVYDIIGSFAAAIYGFFFLYS